MINGFDDQAWAQPDFHHWGTYRPVDFANYWNSVGFVASAAPESGDLVFATVPYDRLTPLPITVAEYLRLGADLVFLDGWQYTLLSDEETEDERISVRSKMSQLSRLSVPLVGPALPPIDRPAA